MGYTASVSNTTIICNRSLRLGHKHDTNVFDYDYIEGLWFTLSCHIYVWVLIDLAAFPARFGSADRDDLIGLCVTVNQSTVYWLPCIRAARLVLFSVYYFTVALVVPICVIASRVV